MNQIKSGQELLESFFSDVTQFDGVDRDTAEVVKRLYKGGMLTGTNISNELHQLRENENDGETEEH